MTCMVHRRIGSCKRDRTKCIIVFHSCQNKKNSFFYGFSSNCTATTNDSEQKCWFGDLEVRNFRRLVQIQQRKCIRESQPANIHKSRDITVFLYLQVQWIIMFSKCIFLRKETAIVVSWFLLTRFLKALTLLGIQENDKEESFGAFSWAPKTTGS